MGEPALLGMSYKTAPVETRERLSVPGHHLPAALSELRALGAQEAVILSTCNRVEIYWTGEDNSAVRRGLMEVWEKRMGAGLGRLTHTATGHDAIRHLFRVASGLDSMVLGEPQILGQVKAAYQSALKAGATGRILNRVFQRAMQAGKRVRSETRIACGITSVAGAAVVLSERIFGDLTQSGIMILGAGKMAEAAARHLLSCKTKELFVANRTFERAQDLARLLGARPLAWDNAMIRTADIDILICSTAAPHYLITPAMAQIWRKTRNGRPLFIIDIAVPRNVDPAVNALENVYVYDIDDLKKVVSDQAGVKQIEAEKAEVLIEALVQDVLNHSRPIAQAPGLNPHYA